MLSAVLLLLTGCGGGQVTNPSETTARTEATMETTAEETTNAPEQTGQYQDASSEDYCIEKPFAAATQGMTQQVTVDYETGVINEAVQRGVDPRIILAERGFPCSTPTLQFAT